MCLDGSCAVRMLSTCLRDGIPFSECPQEQTTFHREGGRGFKMEKKHVTVLPCQGQMMTGQTNENWKRVSEKFLI